MRLLTELEYNIALAILVKDIADSDISTEFSTNKLFDEINELDIFDFAIEKFNHTKDTLFDALLIFLQISEDSTWVHNIYMDYIMESIEPVDKRAKLFLDMLIEENSKRHKEK